MNLEGNRQARIDRILDLYFSCIAPRGVSAELEVSVRQWFGEDLYVEEKYSALEKAFGKYVDYNAKPSAQAVASWLDTMHNLGLPVSEEILAGVARRPRRMRPLFRFATRAAAVLLPALIVVGSWLWLSPRSSEMIAEVVPAGVSIYKVQLPDGTDVWLKSGSRLEYPADFSRHRRIDIEGEAFFNVARDSRHPFIVKTEGVTVRVTGTEFNLSAWSGRENTEVTLYEGSVKVKTANGWMGIKPGEQFDYNQASGVGVTRGVDLRVSDWRVTELKFTDATLDDIFIEVSKVYGIAFEICAGLSGERYMVSFPAGEELSVVLSILKSTTGEFDFEITPEKVIINKSYK